MANHQEDERNHTHRLYNPYQIHIQTLYKLPTSPEFLFQEESVAQRRCWGENLAYYIGTGYLAIAGKGLVDGIGAGWHRQAQGQSNPQLFRFYVGNWICLKNFDGSLYSIQMNRWFIIMISVHIWLYLIVTVKMTIAFSFWANGVFFEVNIQAELSGGWGFRFLEFIILLSIYIVWFLQSRISWKIYIGNQQQKPNLIILTTPELVYEFQNRIP